MANEAPYKIVKRSGKFAVVNNAGMTKAIFSDEGKARDYQKALYASVPGAAKKAAKTPWTGKAKVKESAGRLMVEIHERRAARDAAIVEDPTHNARSMPDAEPAQVLEFAGKTLITGRLRVGEVDELTAAYERAGADNPYHLMLAGRFVQAGRANANGAYWEVADLQFGQPTVKNGPLNWLHEPTRVVGTLIDSQLVTQEAASAVGPHLVVAGVMWKHLHPRLAEMVEEASADGKLAYSMECTSSKVKCSSGDGRVGCGAQYPLGQILTEPASVCEHLRERSSRRWFQDPTFLGGALIVPPVRPAWGDASASVLEAAAKEAERTWSQGEAAGYTQQSWAELVCAAASMA